MNILPTAFRNLPSALLRRNVSAAQTVAYVAAALLGLTVLASGVRFATDALSKGNGAGAYITVTKGTASMPFADPPHFSQAEIDDISAQPWAEAAGAYNTADFDVYASAAGMGRSMSTALFLESVPDRFLDVVPAGWEFDPEDDSPVIPVVIPREYLSLYNYGFAPARGLPQVSESMASLVPIRLSVSGAGHQSVFNARIAGFSDRINTIAVPDGFISWANRQFGQESTPGPSRIIVQLRTPSDPDAMEWLRSHGYTVPTDTAHQWLASVAKGGATVLLATGVLVVALALMIATLSLQLLLYRNRPVLHQLMMLGYSPGHISRPYQWYVTAVNAAVAAASLIIVALARPLWATPMQAAGMKEAAAWPTVVAVVCVALVMTAANWLTIRRRVRDAFKRS